MGQWGTETLLRQTRTQRSYLFSFETNTIVFISANLLNLKYWTYCHTKTIGGTVLQNRKAGGKIEMRACPKLSWGKDPSCLDRTLCRQRVLSWIRSLQLHYSKTMNMTSATFRCVRVHVRPKQSHSMIQVHHTARWHRPTWKIELPRKALGLFWVTHTFLESAHILAIVVTWP